MLATFHAPGGLVEVYVDMTTPAEWDGAVLRAVDLDLDVVRGADRPGVGRRRGRVRRAPGRVRLPRRRGRRAGRCASVGAASGRAVRRARTAAASTVADATAPGSAGSRPERADQAGTGEPALEAAASRLSGWATYSPRITPDASAIATEIAVISARMPCETKKPPSASKDRPR